jgi:transglutaminase/protease-like cytokinesis protein 3
MCVINLLFIALLIASTGIAQINVKQFENVDLYVKKLGPLPLLNVASIADTLTQNFSDKTLKSRAIFSWIANNIALDPKAVRTNDTKNIQPENVILNRKTTSLGFATLVQEMCSLSDIRCLTVDGYSRFNIDQFGEMPDELNHTWNVIQLNTSPSNWYYVDAAKASGSLDKKFMVFTPLFSDCYFFSEKNIFNFDHFPDNNAWMLGVGSKNAKIFFDLPLIGIGAYNQKLISFFPENGFIKSNTTKAVSFAIRLQNDANISDVSIIIGDGATQSKPERVNFTSSNGEIKFNYIFKKEGEYPFKILANGVMLLTYKIESAED